MVGKQLNALALLFTNFKKTLLLIYHIKNENAHYLNKT